jgi:hypothetical protein
MVQDQEKKSAIPYLKEQAKHDGTCLKSQLQGRQMQRIALDKSETLSEEQLKQKKKKKSNNKKIAGAC